MVKVVGIKQTCCKITYYNLNGLEISQGDMVIIPGMLCQEEIAKVAVISNMIDEKANKLENIIRIATPEDIQTKQKCEQTQKEATKIFNEKIKQYDLKMKLIKVEQLFDHSKLLFYFTSDERIDFRELVKDLASIYKTRIELRQVSLREQLQESGGYGLCGRELCCFKLNQDYLNVTIKYAKEQNLSLNPSKISGVCGKLMCCLQYESNVYQDKLEHLPNIGSFVKTKEGDIGIVDNVETLREVIRVKFKDDEGFIYKKFKANDLEVIEKPKDN